MIYIDFQEALEKQKVTGKKVVETIPARNQNCRTNYISSVQQQKLPNKKERLAEEIQLQQQQMALQYSYNSRGKEKKNNSRTESKIKVDENMDSLNMTQVWRSVSHR